MAKASFLLKTYRGLTSVFGPLAGRVLLRWRLMRGKELPRRVAERRGRASISRPDGLLIWLHAASVGELLAILPLVDAILERGFAVLVTTGTVTSATLAQERLPPAAVHQFVPIDIPSYLRRFFNHWRPDLILLAESELWPNLLLEAESRRVPVIVANARMSERSFRRWRYARYAIQALLQRLDLCLAQSRADAARLITLGAPRVETSGNLKFDVPPPPADPHLLNELFNATEGRPIFVAASTHPGEEVTLLRTHVRVSRKIPGLLTIIVPRHPERGIAIMEAAHTLGLTAMLRSAALVPDYDTDIYIADTIGELGLFYRLAHVGFIGGSLVKHGGQNPIEPAKLGLPILHGPHVGNFLSIYNALDNAQGALQVDNEETLSIAVTGLMMDTPARELLRNAAGEVVMGYGGALAHTLASIEPYLMQLRLRRG